MIDDINEIYTDAEKDWLVDNAELVRSLISNPDHFRDLTKMVISPMPVMSEPVSLKKCAKAIDDVSVADSWEERINYEPEKFAKAALDAAKEQGAKFEYVD